MSLQLVRSYRTVDEKSLVFDEEKRSVDVIASSPTEDSYDEIVEQSWELDRYKKNPVILYEHGQAGGFFARDSDAMFPIGKAENVRVEHGVLKATLVFATADISERAERVWRAFKGGFLRAVSVGFRPDNVKSEIRDGKEIYVLSNNELFEISVVGIPANPDAVAEQRSLAIKSIFGGSSEPVSPKKENPQMDLEMLAALLGCKAVEADIQASIKGMATMSLVGRTALTSLGLEASATEADVSKAVVSLLSKASKLDEIEPKFIELQSLEVKRAEADATNDVAWIIKCGEEKRYGVEANTKMQKALLAYRKASPLEFAEQFAVALEGRKAFDSPEMFMGVSGDKPAPQATQEHSDDPVEAIRQQAENLVKRLATTGEHITILQAFDRLARGQE